MDFNKSKPRKKNIKMTLLYKLTRDGDSASTFHSQCDDQGNTLSLIRNTKGFIVVDLLLKVGVVQVHI